MASKRFQNPKGTRDFYPEEMLRRRYITEAWRAVSLRHGFEEIDGPTFEHLELYTVKSGEEIVSQLFSFQRAGGDDTYALRPEFTPTLARMYAARAAQLPKPVRWFSVLPYFRAEKPQRGRLREFLQWNCDVIGDETDASDSELIAMSASSLEQLGFGETDARVRIGSRSWVVDLLREYDVPEPQHEAAIALLDRREKLPRDVLENLAREKGIVSPDFLSYLTRDATQHIHRATLQESSQISIRRADGTDITLAGATGIAHRLGAIDLEDWCIIDLSIVRGLAYYTGTVFEVTAEGERAVAGGGRYDRLIELLGGPPTPAVGFAMGDVVLGNLLEDRGLMPSGAELAEAVESMVHAQRVRPEVFVVSGGEEDDQHVVPLVARLRRGVERPGTDARPWQIDRRYEIRPLHARTTDKATRNLKKLLGDAEKHGARFAAVIHGADKVQLKDLDGREDLPDDFSVNPESDRYVGRVVAGRLDGRAVS